VAEAGGGGADQHLVRAGLVDLDVFDLKRLADFAQDCGLHGFPPNWTRPSGVRRQKPYRRSDARAKGLSTGQAAN
jgi:hypothetical protein